MKNKNIKKIVFALALASAAFGPSVEKSYATEESISLEQQYVDAKVNLRAAIKKAEAIKGNYKYKNSQSFYQKGLDRTIEEATAVLNKADEQAYNYGGLVNMNKATGDLKLAMDGLNGKKASTDKLNELIKAHDEFVKSDAFLYGDSNTKNLYLAAYNEAKNFVTLNTDSDSLSSEKVNRLTQNLEDKKTVLLNDYAPNEAKRDLIDEITLASKLRNDGDKYTKKSFDSFISALRLAETSVEDKSSQKTFREYQELTETLKAARLALVEKVNSEKQAQLDRLEEAIYNNETTIKAAELLFEVAPKKIEPVKAQLLNLIKDSEKLLKEARLAKTQLENEIRGIKG